MWLINWPNWTRMRIDLEKQTVTFTKSSFDGTYKKGEVAHFSMGLAKNWDKRFAFAAVGKKELNLYKLVRHPSTGGMYLFHAFTGMPSTLEQHKGIVFTATLEQKGHK